MENTYDLIINGLIKGGYTTKDAEELVSKFMEEQRHLDEIRDMFHGLVK